jgi:tetratricopeptide (TPR) repeat protein
VSLQSLKLPLTAYQLYAWACAADPNEALLTKTFCLGLVVLASPTKLVPASQTMVWTHVLQHLQGIALTWARLVMSAPPSSSSSSPNNDSAFPMMLTTAWAAQSALWQLQWLPHDEKRNLILPRLAESMTSRLVQQEESPSAEIQWLCLRTLEQQSKYPEMLELLETLPTQDSETPPTSEFGVALTPVQVLQEKARVMIQLEQYEAAVQVYETLLAKSPDDWSSWKGHLQCAEKTSGGTQQTQEWIAKAIAKRQEEDSKYPLRGPHLMKVEVLAHAVRSNAATATPDLLDALSTAIQTYAELFAPRASCAFSDLETYLELLLLTTSETPISTLETLLQFADSMRLNSASNESNTNKERQSKLRAHIFAARVTHKILAKRVELQAKWMPNWKDLVTEWQTSLTLSSSNEGEEVGCCCAEREWFLRRSVGV